MQGTCVFDTGCRGAGLLAWLILNDRLQPSFTAGVGVCAAAYRDGCGHTDTPSCKVHSVYRYTYMPYLTARGVRVSSPFDTGCSPLSYSGNPGVNGVSDREGCGRASGVKGLTDGL